MSNRELNDFQRGYVACALWSSTDESNEQGGDPLDKNYDVDDIADEALEKMKADCDRFLDENPADTTEASRLLHQRADGGASSAGHDFWLTRNSHGAGFWDGDLPEELGGRLTVAAREFGTCDIYVGDDGKLYVS